VIKALDAIAQDKQIDLADSRNKARTAWNELQTIYDTLEPAKKANVLS